MLHVKVLLVQPPICLPRFKAIVAPAAEIWPPEVREARSGHGCNSDPIFLFGQSREHSGSLPAKFGRDPSRGSRDLAKRCLVHCTHSAIQYCTALHVKCGKRPMSEFSKIHNSSARPHNTTKLGTQPQHVMAFPTRPHVLRSEVGCQSFGQKMAKNAFFWPF